MRELIFKNLTSENRRRKDLYILESYEKDGIRTVTQRHSVYVINNHIKFKTPQELVQWQEGIPPEHKLRHIFICRKHNSQTKEDVFSCDVVGKFYAVIKDEVYTIGFKHSFEVDFSVIDKKEEGGGSIDL